MGQKESKRERETKRERLKEREVKWWAEGCVSEEEKRRRKSSTEKIDKKEGEER